MSSPIPSSNATSSQRMADNAARVISVTRAAWGVGTRASGAPKVRRFSFCPMHANLLIAMNLLSQGAM